MNFKEQLEEDLKDIFFNEEEFAEKVNIEGILVSGIFSKKKFISEYLDKSEEQELGLFQRGVCLSLNYHEISNKFKSLPEVSEQISINDILYEVLTIDDKSGVYTLYLQTLED